VNKIVKHIIYTLLVILFSTAVLTLYGIYFSWANSKNELPFLNILIPSIIIESAAIFFLFVKKSLKYIPEVLINESIQDTTIFMKNFISTGTTVTIVSNRVSWLFSNDDLINHLKNKIDEGIKIEIITPSELSNEHKEKLNKAIFINSKENMSPYSRFTLINGDRNGSEKLAIAKGTHPEHEITIFNSTSGPQIIAMAKDIIRKSKGIST